MWKKPPFIGHNTDSWKQQSCFSEPATQHDPLWTSSLANQDLSRIDSSSCSASNRKFELCVPFIPPWRSHPFRFRPDICGWPSTTPHEWTTQLHFTSVLCWLEGLGERVFHHSTPGSIATKPRCHRQNFSSSHQGLETAVRLYGWDNCQEILRLAPQNPPSLYDKRGGRRGQSSQTAPWQTPYIGQDQLDHSVLEDTIWM